MRLLVCSVAQTQEPTFGLYSHLSSSSLALPSKITHPLLQRLNARNNSIITNNNLLNNHHEQKHQPTQQRKHPNEHHQCRDELSASCFTDNVLSDFLNDHEVFNITHNEYNTTSINIEEISRSFESCLTEKDDYDGGEMDSNWMGIMTQMKSSGDEKKGVQEGEEGEEGEEASVVDFHFLDDIGPPCYYSPFEIAEEIGEPESLEAEGNEDEPSSMLGEAMKRMKYERKISASLYAFNGIPECLKVKLEAGNGNGRGRSSDLITSLRKACDRKRSDEEKVEEEEEYQQVMNKMEEEEDKEESCSPEMESFTSSEGDWSIWSSLDLPPICFVN